MTWKNAPDRAGFWWWASPRTQDVEMVDARQLGLGHICLYSCSKEWGGYSIETAQEYLGGLWAEVEKPEFPTELME